MTITLSDEARRLMGLFAEITDVRPRDCLVRGDDRVVFVVPAGEMSTAIGPDGRTVGRVEDRAGVAVDLVEDADRAETFVANALSPAAVRNVTVSEQGDTTVAYAEVPENDRGAAIGADGRNIGLARDLAARHFDVDDVQLA